MLTLDDIRVGVAEIARDYCITRADLFGSYAKGTNHSDSDVDLLLEFVEPSISLLTLCEIKNRLEETFRTSVDVVHGPLPDGSMLEIDRRIPIYGA